MPDAARPELRFPSNLSQSIVESLILISVTIIDTSSVVHLRSSQLFLPDRSTPAFSPNAHHNRSLRMQLRAVWYHHLIGDTEGPTLITNTTWYYSFQLSYLLGTPTTSLTQGDSAFTRLTDECLGFGILRCSTSCIHAVVVALSYSMD